MRTFITLLSLLAATLATHAQDRFVMTGPYTGGATKVYAANDGTLYAITVGAQVVRSTDDGITWRKCGPFQSDSAGIKFVSLLTIDSAGLIYAGTNRYVWRSADRGEHWTLRLPVKQDTLNAGFNSFMESSPDGVVYANYGTGIGDTVVYRSNDHGDHWSDVTLPPGAQSIWQLSVAPEGTIFAGCWGCVWRSSDQGGSWTKTTLEISDAKRPAVLVAHGNGKLWAFIQPDWTFHSSIDNGVNWKQIVTTGLAPNTQINNLAISRQGTFLASTQLGIYRSVDSGRTWSQVDSVVSIYASCWVAASPVGGVIEIVGGLRRSIDEGLHWEKVPDVAIPAQVTALAETYDGEILLAGTLDNLYRSSDHGRTWSESNSGLPSGQLIRRIEHGSGNTLFTTGFTGGIYGSSDDGISWRAKNTGLPVDWVRNIIVLHSGVLLLSAAGQSGQAGIYRSSDNGEHWSRSDGGIPTSSVWDVAQAGDGSVLAATEGNGIWRSTDDGASWRGVNTGGITLGNITTVYVTPDGLALAGAGDPSSTNGLSASAFYRSSDNGVSWELMTGMVRTNFGFLWTVNEAGTIYAGAQMLLRSTDNGNSWLSDLTPLTGGVFPTSSPLTWGLMIDHEGVLRTGIPYGGFQGHRVLSSDSGTVWIRNPFAAGEVRAILDNGHGNEYIATSRGVWYTSNMTDTSWINIQHDLPTEDVRLLAFTQWYPYGFAVTSDGLYRVDMNTDSSHSSWKHVGQGLPSGGISALAVKLSGKWVFAGTDHGVYRSNDTVVTFSPAITGLEDVPINALVISGGRTLFAASPGHGLYRSEDDAQSWSRVKGGLPAGDVISLAVIGPTGIYAGTDGAGVYRSTDNGVAWTPAGSELAGEKITSIVVNSDGLVFAGTEHGAYRSTDRGANWKLVNEGNGDTVRTVSVGGNGRIFIATEKGLFMSTTAAIKTPPTLSVDRDHALETVSGDAMLTVVQTRTGAEIRYELLRAGHVVLALYDALGREVRMLLDGEQSSGEHTLSFETASLSSGMYFLRLVGLGRSSSISFTIAR